MSKVNGLRYAELRGCSRDLVEDVERVALALVEKGRCEVQLVSAITHPLRAAMVGLTPQGMYVAFDVDWDVYPAMWTFWFERMKGERRGRG